MGYHKREIPRGTWKEFSKIVEEFVELQDAHEQGVKIMELCELADLYGAIEGYVEDKFGLTMDDIAAMNERTSAAFKSGTRVSNDAPKEEEAVRRVPRFPGRLPGENALTCAGSLSERVNSVENK